MTARSPFDKLASIMSKPDTINFIYHRRVHFYETDALGIVHHSNYLRFFEEARMAWLKYRELHHLHAPHGPMTMALLETRTRHHRPAMLDDELSIRLQLRLEGAKIRFSYALTSQRYNEPVATGETLHVALDKNLKVVRLPKDLNAELENEAWIETWPSSLYGSPKPPR